MGDDISVSINTDNDGYLSQECPSCGKRFKVKFEAGSDKPIRHCPYCNHQGEGCWWTQAQADYLGGKAAEELIDPMLDKMAKDFNRPKRGGFIDMSMKVTKSPTPNPPDEPNEDWPTATFACCGETIKHAPDAGDLHCIICGHKPGIA